MTTFTTLLLLMPLSVQAQQRTIHDAKDHLTFSIPTTWQLSTHDHELSTFHQEARTAPKTAQLRYVSAIVENPLPLSTLSGAHIYLSFTPSQSAVQCKAQTNPLPPDRPTRTPVPLNTTIQTIDGLSTSHGHDESGAICTQFRDEIYTVHRKKGCLRIDLAMNNFCGGEVSGARDMTPNEILDIRGRLESILLSIKFDR